MRTMFIGAVCAALWLCGGVAHGQGKNSPNCGADLIPTVVVHANATGNEDDPRTHALVSDSRAPYGGTSKENVRLQINNCTFDLVMNFSTSRRRVLAYIRNTGTTAVPLTLLNFDRLASVPLTEGLVKNGDTFGRWNVEAASGLWSFEESSFCNNGLQSNPPPQDNYAGCGVDELGKVYVRRTLTAQIEGREDRRLVMQTSPLDGHSKPLREYCTANPTYSACFTSYVRVYRTDATTWLLAPEPRPDGSMLAVENLHTSTGVQPGAIHVLPFGITVTVPPVTVP